MQNQWNDEDEDDGMASGNMPPAMPGMGTPMSHMMPQMPSPMNQGGYGMMPQGQNPVLMGSPMMGASTGQGMDEGMGGGFGGMPQMQPPMPPPNRGPMGAPPAMRPNGNQLAQSLQRLTRGAGQAPPQMQGQGQGMMQPMVQQGRPNRFMRAMGGR